MLSRTGQHARENPARRIATLCIQIQDEEMPCDAQPFNPPLWQANHCNGMAGKALPVFRSLYKIRIGFHA
ncbi:hypothetical protein [uncultured Ralstonia sp.]|jgi:hypothetical protein|uniref:hypothetical protein n=1 Tax=Ralstonia sp. TaxID=54061 RepID=UPI000EE63262|nr:hypothetical protein [uncultured Ralstonia sp.]UCF21791.1 MAG: hypothetical protein JSV72_12295 [Ralstonia sp.]HCE07031.1 hypothetical protein [Oxalobacteraceae bacterium]